MQNFKLTVTANIAVMALSYCLLLVLVLANVSSASRRRNLNVGCTLLVPDRVKERMEPFGHRNKTTKEEPVSIFMKIKILGVRDVPDSGGSYGVDIR